MNSPKIERILVYILPTMQDFVFLVIFVSVFVLGPRMMNIDGDLGRHLTIGSYILEHKQIPTADIFSHTKTGDSLTPHEWLSQLVFAGFNRVFGLNGVVLICALVLALAYTMIFQLSIRSGAGILGAMLYTFAAAAASSLHWLTRPHLFTILFMVLWVWVLEDLRRGKTDRWWYLPIIMLFWVNFHGAYIAGFVSLGLYLLGIGWDRAIHPEVSSINRPKALRYWVFGAGTALLVTLINPVGIKIWETSIGFLKNRYLVSHTAEYFPPNFQDPSTWPFFLLLIGALLLLGLIPTRMPAAHVVLFSGWAAMALYSTRNIPLFTIAAAPIYAILLNEFGALEFARGVHKFNRSLEHTNQQLIGKVLPGFVSVLTAVALLFAPGQLTSRNVFSPQVFPVGAADWLSENPQPGEMYNYFPWGGYLLYRHWPEERVFIDGQTDFYGEALTREYETVLTLQNGWQGILRKYDIDWVIMPEGSRLAEALELMGTWERVYQDETTVILRGGL